MSITFLEVDENFIELMNVHRQVEPGTNLIKACSESPIIFAEKMLGVRPYAWQVFAMSEWSQALKSKGTKHDKESIILSSRQIGKSTAVAIFTLWACVFNKYPHGTSNNTTAGIISASDDQAKKLLYEVEKLIRVGDSYIADTYQKDGTPIFGKKFLSDLLDAAEANNTKTITFKKYNKAIHKEYLLKDSKNGSMLKSYPPTSVVLGETFSIVIIDEAGKNDRIEDKFFYDYVYPTGNAANALRIYTSTPWEPVGFFYEKVDPDGTIGSKARIIAFTIDAIRLENPNYYETVKQTIDEMVEAGKLDEVQRGYYCRFVKGDLSYFDPEAVRGMFTEFAMVEQCKDPCDLGLDFGGKITSKTCITISKQDNEGVVHRLYKRKYDVGKDETLLVDIEELMTRFNIQRIIPDNCPAGHYIIKEMVRRGWNIQPTDGKENHGMVFRTDKVKKYGSFRSMLNNGKVKSFNDNDLKTEMLALQFNNGAKNSVINHAPGYTDDEIDSFVMSCYFYLSEDTGVKFYEPKSKTESILPEKAVRRARERNQERLWP